MSSDPAEPVEIIGDYSKSPNASNRINNISRLAISPPVPQPNALSRSQPQKSGVSPNRNLAVSPNGRLAVSPNGRFPGPSSYGSFEHTAEALDIPKEKKAEIVKKHLVTPDDLARSAEANSSYVEPLFSTSIQLPGGDATHEVYKWHQDVESEPLKRSRSKSLYLPRSELSDPHFSNIRQPGGFRRHYVSMKAQQEGKEPPNFFTENFIDFLTMYGHFAGEDLSDDEDEEGILSEYVEVPVDEESPLIPIPGEVHGTASPSKAVFLLLKSFVGTGVMFLPKAFSNGGMIFSTIVLMGIGGISLFAFLLLVEARRKIPYSFGDIGGVLFGNWMRYAVLFSITISQIGFVCAYMIFVAENLASFTKNALDTHLDMKYFILLQVLCFIPLSMIRKIARLSFTALIADAFILFGLIYLYYYDILTLAKDGVQHIKLFNPQDFALFIGTAVFTFEGIGLIIPITESMKEPEKFPKVLTGVMIFVTILFTSVGVLSYAAFGDEIKTVVILNLPSDDSVVQSVQLLYALAILLSIPLQLFPAIRIMEQGLFTKSGKADPWVKWQKNLFRVIVVIACALIAFGGASDLDKFAAAETLRAKIFDVTMILFGLTALIYTTYITMKLWTEAENSMP
ncbi:3361_t:CDS:2 [Ambispora leptoticha]|uniref:3361_t:CDS:1 n=1 Tax=Ambispora leptoticha TaxID=144679 RepID=A0A9N8VDF3_9GLOM|nr:3361_t:CDS:2 [Ambispora leptoticha]